MRDEGIFLQAADYSKEKVEVSVASSKYFSITRPAGRTARIVSALASDEVEEIVIRPMNGDSEVARISFDRKEFDQVDKSQSSPSELFAKYNLSSHSDKPLT